MNGYSTPKFHTIRRAIRQQMVLTFVYGGQVCTVEPYGIGLGRGRLLLRGFERKAMDGAEGGWRVYDVSRLASVTQTGESCLREREGFRADDPAMNRVLTSRQAFTGRLRFDVPALKRKQRAGESANVFRRSERPRAPGLLLCAHVF